MRPRRSTVVVFVAVAAAWSAIFYLTLVTYIHSYQQLEDSGITERSLLVKSLHHALVILTSPMEYVVGTSRSLSHLSHGLWLYDSAPPFAGMAINSAAWATLVTVAFVLVRRLRERRAASHDA